MSSIKNKKQRSKYAKEHTEYVSKEYKDTIKYSIRKSILYGYPDKIPQKTNKEKQVPKMLFVNSDSVSAAFEHCTGRTAILNFASYKNPGGGFLKGSIAQEEALCTESFLYNVLSEQKSFYEYNNDHKNKALYENRAIYSPSIIFERKTESLSCDVISCAAPNKTAAQKFSNATDEENEHALKSRISFIKNIAEENNVNTLILGAFGTGVFGQNPEEVALIFKETFEKTTVSNIIFAVPGKNETTEIFKKIFKKEN